MLPLFNLQIFLFCVWFKKYTKQCQSVQWRWKVFVKSTQDVDIWIEIPIQHDVYIWANYSVSSYLNFIPIFWNIILCISLYTIFPCTLTYNLWEHCEYTGSWIWGQIQIFALRANDQHLLLAIIGHAKMNLL